MSENRPIVHTSTVETPKNVGPRREIAVTLHPDTLHVGTGTAFYLSYCGDLVDEIVEGRWAPHEETVGGGLW